MPSDPDDDMEMWEELVDSLLHNQQKNIKRLFADQESCDIAINLHLIRKTCDIMLKEMGHDV